MDRQLDNEDYTIGWICALSVEFAAAVAILDERHPPLPQDELDDNSYEFGCVGHYNIIIACLPSGVYGVTSAANVATLMRRSFPSVIVGLMVGIGGGAPAPQHDIRLGDVVVSEPGPGSGGVLQYDFGKTVQEGRFVQTGVLNKPPNIFLKAISKLKAERLMHRRNDIDDIIAATLEDKSVLDLQEFARPPVASDRLFQAQYDHLTGSTSCDQCDQSMVVERPSRSQEQPNIHYGLIASGNQIMRHGITRDNISREKGVLCFEMEAAGLMDELPTLVIRGICDYSDSHKSKIWQPYAALAAAAFAKVIVLQLPRRASDRSRRGQKVSINLPTSEGAVFGSYEDQDQPECLPGTRVDLLNQISEWADNPQGETIFWLVGKAGTGKSTISRTVARTLQENGHLGASFFFKRGEADRSNSALLFPTIASQLANRFRSLIPSIQKAMDTDSSLPKKALREQFEKLIYQPFCEMPIKVSSHKTKSIIVIDALDECEGKDDMQIIIWLLAQLNNIEAANLRVLLTSRPELSINPTFKRLSQNKYTSIVLHEVPEVEVQHDISLFLEFKLSRIREQHSLPRDWPGDENIQRLTKRAAPLFVYAATLCRFIGDENWAPDERIKTILEDKTGWAPQLHKTYLPILDRLIVGQDVETERLAEEFRQTVGTIINLASPLSLLSLACLLSLSEKTVDYRLKPLHSVLNIPDDRHSPIRIFHLSFRDFLLDNTLRGKYPFWIDEKESHFMIASKCIDLMSSEGLKENICNLKSPGTLRHEIDSWIIEDHLPSELRYACRYWVHHLVQSRHRLINNCQTHKFLQEHLLHWLEVMGILGHIIETLNAVDNLASIVATEDGENLSEFIHDVKRFVIQNRYIIDKAPLQTYSAIIFLPTKSLVRQIFDPAKTVKWVCKLPRVEDEWGSLLQTLEGHKDSVNSVALSPDDKFLASTSGDKTIRLWEAATGAPLQTLQGHKDRVSAVAFSHNNKLLASGSRDETVKLWDVTTGVLLQTLEHTGWVNSVAFSPTLLASGSNQGTIELWDAVTGEPLQTLDLLKSRVHSLAFTHDGQILISGLEDGIIKLWTAATGAPLRTLDSYKSFSHTHSVAASRGNNFLASSFGNTINLWDAITGTLLQELAGHTNFVRSVEFSYDGSLLASSSADKTIRLWNVSTRAVQGVLLGHTDSVNSVAFFHDDKLLASASNDRTVRIWDIATGAPLQNLQGHTEMVAAVTFSSKGGLLASASFDSTIMLWDVATGLSLKTLRGDMGPVTKVVFSSDDRLLAFSSLNNVVGLWEVATGSLLRMLYGHMGSIRVIMFSSDDKLLASSSHDKMVIIWNVTTGAPLQTLQGHMGLVDSIVFSPNSKFLATGSADKEVRLWDVITGAVLQKLQGHTDLVDTIVFSPDSKFLATGSGDKTVRLWDVVSGTPLQILLGRGSPAHALAFSPNDSLLALASQDQKLNIVTLWDTNKEVAVRDFVVDRLTKSLSFSPDGRHIIIGRWCFACRPNTHPVHYEVDQNQILGIRREWLTRGDENIIWLPHSYRPGVSANYENTIALGSSSGLVSFMELNSEFDLQFAGCSSQSWNRGTNSSSLTLYSVWEPLRYL
ncbi:hypothetical protein ABW20_dc0108314 [Dactylellina cionopaga]|nr:hypothetical protein ABW20_dc0108314 [Dactylellina cionopaga]